MKIMRANECSDIKFSGDDARLWSLAVGEELSEPEFTDHADISHWCHQQKTITIQIQIFGTLKNN